MIAKIEQGKAVRLSGELTAIHESLGYSYFEEDPFIKDENGNSYTHYIDTPDENGKYQPDYTAIENAIILANKNAAKLDKVEKLDRLTVTTDSGKVFYADTNARVDLQAAIDGADLRNLTEIQWKLAEKWSDNPPIAGTEKVYNVTLDEIREASARALEAKGRIVGAIS